MIQRLLSKRDAAKYLGISPNGFERHCREQLTEHRIGGRVLWDRQEIDAKIIGEVQPLEESNEIEAMKKAALAQL